MTNYAETANQLQASINILTPLEDDTLQTSTLRRAYHIYCATGHRTAVAGVWDEIVERWGEPIDGRLPVGHGVKIGRFDLQWLETLAELAKFYSEHGERPQHDGTRDGEASLCQWMSNQRRTHRDSTLTPERKAILDQRIPGWLNPYDQKFMRRVNEWVRFTDEHGEWPQKEGVGDGEASLYEWMGKQRTKRRNGTLKPERKAILDQRIPGWFIAKETPDQAFLRRVNEWVSFTDEHGEWPQQKGVRDGEVSLYRWMREQRTAHRNGTLTSEWKAILGQRIPGWLTETLDQTFLRRVNEWVNFTDKHGEWPQNKGVRDGEVSLYNWINKQRFKHRKGTLAPERKVILDQRIPEWLEAVETPDQTFLRRVDEWVNFIDEHGEWPQSKGVRYGEASLHDWMGRQRTAHRAGTLTPERKVILDQRILGWSITKETPDQAFLRRVNEWVNFIDEHGERPQESGTRYGEVSLYKWMMDQFCKHRNGTLTPERKAILDQRIPGWLSNSRDQAFLRRVNEWVSFTNKHGEWPQYKGARDGEASLYNWMIDQRRKHRAGTIKPERKAILDQRIPGWSD